MGMSVGGASSAEQRMVRDNPFGQGPSIGGAFKAEPVSAQAAVSALQEQSSKSHEMAQANEKIMSNEKKKMMEESIKNGNLPDSGSYLAGAGVIRNSIQQSHG